jgi:hypothetical protein
MKSSNGSSSSSRASSSSASRRERDVECDAPAERVAAQREPAGRLREHLGYARVERDGALEVGHPAVPREVQRERPVAFTVELIADAVPGMPRAAEPVEQDERLGHDRIL